MYSICFSSRFAEVLFGLNFWLLLDEYFEISPPLGNTFILVHVHVMLS